MTAHFSHGWMLLFCVHCDAKDFAPSLSGETAGRYICDSCARKFFSAQDMQPVLDQETSEVPHEAEPCACEI